MSRVSYKFAKYFKFRIYVSWFFYLFSPIDGVVQGFSPWRGAFMYRALEYESELPIKLLCKYKKSIASLR